MDDSTELSILIFSSETNFMFIVEDFQSVCSMGAMGNLRDVRDPFDSFLFGVSWALQDFEEISAFSFNWIE